ncbi:hypothetical protein [Plantactinospora soyae]|uniref:Membrane protein n=1 Tax=Plantactinospora soyae TaxID=1544732 RepID=A0A927MAN2_9ACTN|nr:hypothetical protein [Plantactinospora soyae]MBE1491077.1 putative membrane protein [Plantactinospora soyae]
MGTRTIVVLGAVSAALAVVALIALLTGGPDQKISSVALLLSFLGMLVATLGIGFRNARRK